MKELIIEYAKESRLSLEEEEEMDKIIKHKKLFEELKTKEITSFSYHHLEYLYFLNEDISIIPSFDGTRCKFSISPPLPLGLIINKESGIINGKVENEIEKKEYEIACKNVKNKKKFKISIEFVDIKLTELNKSDGISMSLLFKFKNGEWNLSYQISVS